MHLKDEAAEYLESAKIEELLQHYSEFIEFPISVWKETTTYEQVPDEEANKIGELLCPLYGEKQFNNIIRFMAGNSPDKCAPEKLTEPGSEKCIAIVYEGPDAVKKIRDVLGPTDPSKAPPGSIRREFGRDIMFNAAHASDSSENAMREIGIVDFSKNPFQ